MGCGRVHSLAAEVSEDIWTWWRFLRGDDAPFVLHRQLSVCPSSTSTTAPATLSRSMPGSNCRVRHRYFTVLSLATVRLYFRHRIVLRDTCPFRARYAVSVCLAGTPKRSLKGGRKSANTRLVSSTVAACASLGSVTSLSWNVPALRSTLPLA